MTTRSYHYDINIYITLIRIFKEIYEKKFNVAGKIIKLLELPFQYTINWMNQPIQVQIRT